MKGTILLVICLLLELNIFYSESCLVGITFFLFFLKLLLLFVKLPLFLNILFCSRGKLCRQGGNLCLLLVELSLLLLNVFLFLVKYSSLSGKHFCQRGKFSFLSNKLCCQRKKRKCCIANSILFNGNDSWV